MMRVILFHLVPTLIPPVYFGATDGDWVLVPIYSALCALWLMWTVRRDLAIARHLSFSPDAPGGLIFFANLSMFFGLTGVLCVVHSLAFFLSKSLF